MKPGNPWSVKGIQPAARQAAKEAARRHGMTLGQWLNHVIMDSNGEQSDTAVDQQAVQPQQPVTVPAAPQPANATAPKSQHLHDKIEDLAARLDSIVNKQSGQVDLDQWEAERGRSSGWSDIAVRNIDCEELSPPAQQAVCETAPKPHPEPDPGLGEKSDIFGERISALTDKLDSVAQAKHATKSHSDQNLLELETALRNVINHIETSDRQNTEVIKSIQTRLSELSSRNIVSNNSTVQHLNSTVGQLDDRLSHLSHRILKTETDSNQLLGFEEEIKNLANRLDNSLDRQTEPQVLALEERMQQIATQLDEFIHASKNSHAADQIDTRLNEMSSRVKSTEQQCLTISSLEDSINQLFDAIEQNRNIAQENIFNASQKSIETMETMVGHAAQKAAENAAQRSAKHVAAIMADDGLNKKEITASIAALRDEMRKSQETAIKAVHRDIGEVISAGISSEVTKAIAEPMMVLQREFDQLQINSKSSELRNQDTLEAVHDTLEKVVERLVTLETSPQQNPERPPLPFLSVPEIDLVPPAKVGQTFHISDDMADETVQASHEDEPEVSVKGSSDFGLHSTHLEPASSSQYDKRMDPVFSDPYADKISTEKKSSDKPSPTLNHNYLEAARRAALAASQMPRNLSNISGEEEAHEDGMPGSKSSLLAMATESDKKRKTLLLVAAAVLLIIGALSAGSLVTGKPSIVVSSSIRSPAIASGKGTSKNTPAKVNQKPDDKQPGSPPESAKPAISPVSQNTSGSPARAVLVSTVKVAPTPQRPTTLVSQRAETPRTNRLASPGADLSASPEITASVAPHNKVTGTTRAGLAASSVKIARLSTPVPDKSTIVKEAPSARPSGMMPPEAIGPIALRRAAARGDETAQFEIAARYTSGKLVPQNFNKAIFWYQKAAAQGLAPAQYRLGTFYEQGRGIAQDKTVARIWYERAAEKGNLKAIHNLAVIYADGSNGKPDFAKAGLWFRKAAELGLADSQYNLAILHDRGLGVSKDPSKAYFWFQIAGNQGDKDAQARAFVLEKSMTPDQIAQTKLLIRSWSPVTLNKSANEVTLPFDGWQSVASIQTVPSTSEKLHFSQNNLVGLAQGYLTRLGFDTGPGDGILGTQTREAIEKFQQQNQLPVSGEVTPALVSKLKAAAG